MPIFIRPLSIAWVLGVLLSPISHAALVADYPFNGDLTSSAGSAADLVYLGSSETYSTVTVDGESVQVLNFELGSGLRFDASSLASLDEYSVAMKIRLDANPSWQKLIDTSDLDNDPGLYVFGNYAIYLGPDPEPDYNSAWEILDTKFFQLFLTRSATDNRTRVFIDGIKQFSFIDDGGVAVINAMENLHFLIDDVDTSTTENPVGQIDRIRIWDTSLSDAEIADLNRSGSGGVPLLAQLADYQFSDTLTSDVGDISDLEYLGDTAVFSEGSLLIPANSGLRLVADEPGEISKDHYTIAMDISLDDIAGQQKLIDFSSLLLQRGLYSDNGFPVFNPSTPDNGLAAIPADDATQVLITRNRNSERVSTYINGKLRHSFIDDMAYAEVNADSELYFMVDDTSGGAQHPEGSIDRLRIWDGPMVPAQIDALNPISVIFDDSFEPSEK